MKLPSGCGCFGSAQSQFPKEGGGGTNRVFGKPGNRVFVPCHKAAVLTKEAKMTTLHSTH